MRRAYFILAAFVVACGSAHTAAPESGSTENQTLAKNTDSVEVATAEACVVEESRRNALCPEGWGVCKTCVTGAWEVRLSDGSLPFVAAWLDTDDDGQPETLVRRKYDVMGNVEAEDWYRQIEPTDVACSPKNRDRWTTTVYRLGKSEVEYVSGDGYVLLKDTTPSNPRIAKDRCLQQTDAPRPDVVDRALSDAQLLFDDVRQELWRQEAPKRQRRGD